MASLDNSSTSQVLTVDAKAAKALIDSAGYIYLDVRSEELLKKGHVDGENMKIFNIPYYFTTPQGRVKNPDFLKELSAVCKEEDKIIVGCGTGGRSLSATADILTAGFKDVKNMGGGYRSWMENKFPSSMIQEHSKNEH